MRVPYVIKLCTKYANIKPKEFLALSTGEKEKVIIELLHKDYENSPRWGKGLSAITKIDLKYFYQVRSSNMFEFHIDILQVRLKKFKNIPDLNPEYKVELSDFLIMGGDLIPKVVRAYSKREAAVAYLLQSNGDNIENILYLNTITGYQYVVGRALKRLYEIRTRLNDWRHGNGLDVDIADKNCLYELIDIHKNDL